MCGDFNAKIGEGKDGDVVGPFGLGQRNTNGRKLCEFAKQFKVFLTKTWFEQKPSTRYTLTSPDNRARNQIDYILANTRFRNSVRNSKSRPGADCGSDHQPVVMDTHT